MFLILLCLSLLLFGVVVVVLVVVVSSWARDLFLLQSVRTSRHPLHLPGRTNIC